MKTQFKTQLSTQIFEILPSLHIEWNRLKKRDFAIVFAWLRFVAGVRFILKATEE